MNGHGARSSRREKSRRHDSQESSLDEDEEVEDHAGHRFLKRKTARAAINKMRLLDASDDNYEEEEEKEAKKLKRSSTSRLRQTPSKRTAVIQSDSDSEDASSAQGRRSF